jgi:hypothetical protein
MEANTPSIVLLVIYLSVWVRQAISPENNAALDSFEYSLAHPLCALATNKVHKLENPLHVNGTMFESLMVKMHKLQIRYR